MKVKAQWGAKTLLVVSALGTGILVLNCGETKREIEGKKITVTKYMPVESKSFNYAGHIVKHLAASRDGNNLYAAVDDAANIDEGRLLFHNDGKDLYQGWKSVKLETDFDDSPGKAKLETTKGVANMSAAKDGVLVSILGTRETVPPRIGSSLDNGVVYLRGEKAENAWANKPSDLGSVARGGPVDGRFYVSIEVTGIVVSNDGEDVPYFFSNNSADAGTFVGTTRENLMAGVANAIVKRATNAFAQVPKLAAGGNFLFAIDNTGMSAIAKTNIGRAQDFPAVQGADPTDANGKIGHESFGMMAGQNNGNPNAILATDKHVFIGFLAPRADTGGVGVYEIGTTNFKAPDISWNGIAVLQLLGDSNGKIWAVTESDVIEVKDEGKKGGSYITQFDESVETFDGAKNGYKQESFPRAGIRNAAFIKDKLVVGTNKGLFVPRDIDKVIPGTKVIEVSGK